MRHLLLFALLLAGCSKGPEADLASISEARSLAAEWALVNEQAAKGQLNATYVHVMRQELRQQLETSATSLKHPGSRYGIEIHAVLRLPDDAPPQELRAHAAALKAIEDNLESA
jgi:hypothetical protein